MQNTENAKLIEKYFSAWDHLSPQEQEAILNNANLVSYKKGTSIHNADSECLGFFIVKSGKIRAYMLSEEGREITLYRLEKGEMCILSASCVLSEITFEVHVDAEEDSELLLVGPQLLAGIAERNIYVECFEYRLATERFSDVMWAMQQILFMSMDKRLAVFLWDEFSNAQGDTIKITHEQAARYIGSAREVVTRMLKYFANEGIVELSRGGIRLLDKEKLRALTK